MQPEHELHTLHRRVVLRFCRQRLAGVRVIAEIVSLAPQHGVAIGSADLHAWRLATVLLDKHGAQLGVGPPGCQCLVHHLADRRAWSADGLVLVGAVEVVVKAFERGPIGTVGHGADCRHVLLCKEH